MKCVETFETHSGEETKGVGRRLAPSLSGLVLLSGDLGAGKTTLTQGIVEGRLGTPQDVTSPTFTLIHEYGNPVAVHHADLYRLDSLSQASRLGLDELLDTSPLLLVEWGERFPQLWPEDRTEIRIKHLGDDSRLIAVFC
jgi:tRNA threonylcarbamoyladenosine biosynthesis protein TsaE